MSTPVTVSGETDDQASSCFRGFLCPSPSGSPGTVIINQFNNNHNNGRRIGQPTEDYEEILNEGMKHLTFDEIQHEQELLHGVAANELDLSERTIHNLISSLEEHLNQAKSGTAYETAEQ